MPIIGNPIYQSAFVVDQFSGNGSTVAFTMSVAPAGVTNVLVSVSGVLQDPSTYGVVGNTITFSAAPPSGTGNISCRYLGIPVTGVTTTAYRTVTEFTATASQTTFTPPSYTVGFINVYLNGVLLGSADYTATNGTTVVLTTGASSGNLVTVESFLVSSVLNAIPNTAGAVSSANIANDVTINFADGSASTPSITNNGDTNTGIFFPAADTIAFTEGGTESMRITSTGNLGLGTTNPSADYFTQARLLQITGSNSAAIKFERTDATARKWEIGLTSGGNFDITDTVASTSEPRFRIDTSGQVGIGTTSPSNPLDVKSNSGAAAITMRGRTSDNISTFRFTSDDATSTYGQIQSRSNGLWINAVASIPMQFFTADTERMRITSGGDLFVGATTTIANEKLNVTNAVASGAFGVYIKYSGSSPNGNSNEFLYCSDSTTVRAYIKSNGGIGNYSANNTNLSDERTKKDIVNAGNYLDKICAIPVRTFLYKDQTDNELNLGVVAQEVEAVAPELVDNSGFGGEKEGEIPLKAIYQTDLQYALMKSIQELKAELDATKAEVQALKGTAL